MKKTRWIQKLLPSKRRAAYPVRPVVLIPRWSVAKGLEHGVVCVIEPKEVPDYLGGLCGAAQSIARK